MMCSGNRNENGKKKIVEMQTKFPRRKANNKKKKKTYSKIIFFFVRGKEPTHTTLLNMKFFPFITYFIFAVVFGLGRRKKSN